MKAKASPSADEPPSRKWLTWALAVFLLLNIEGTSISVAHASNIESNYEQQHTNYVTLHRIPRITGVSITDVFITNEWELKDNQVPGNIFRLVSSAFLTGLYFGIFFGWWLFRRMPR